MADTDDENTDVIDIKAKRKSRRSSIFHRKSLCNYESRQSIEAEENCNSNSSSIVDRQEEKRKLLEYLQDLENENKDWKSLLRSYKARYSTLKEQKNKPQVLDVSSWTNFLTDEDKQFLNGRPDCIAIGRKLDEAIDSVKMCMKIHSELMTVTCNTVRKAKQEMNMIKRCIYDKALENEEIQCMFNGNESMETFLSTNSESGY